jgi:site-specific recombinase XerD
MVTRHGVATSLRARAALSLCYGCGLRAGEMVRLKVKHIDSAQKIIRIEQSNGRKDRNVVLSPERSIRYGSGGRRAEVSMHTRKNRIDR